MEVEPTGQHGNPHSQGSCLSPAHPTHTHLLAHKEAGSHSQPMSEVVYGVGQQVEIATDLGEGRESQAELGGQGWARPATRWGSRRRRGP